MKANRNVQQIAADAGVLTLENPSHKILVKNNYGQTITAPVYGQKSVALVVRSLMVEWLSGHIAGNVGVKKLHLDAHPLAHKYFDKLRGGGLWQAVESVGLAELVEDYNASHSQVLKIEDISK
jgi:hypothetical protein